MRPLVSIMMFGWVPLVLALFALLPARRAVLIAAVGGWLFLPQATYPILNLPDYDKTAAINLGLLLGAALFDMGSLLSFRPRWIDLPVLLWCGWALPSALSNHMGLYAGVAAVGGHLLDWGVPYFIGRVYFRNAQAVRDLAIGLFAGGLIYVPLCLYEIRMSPLLHYYIYGFHQHQWAQTIRLGGWRPAVFLPHGLDLGIWMTIASVAGIALWSSGALRRLAGIPVSLLLLVLLVTTFMCKSLGALALLAVGIAAIGATRLTGLRLAMLAIIVAAPLYMALRITHTVSRDTVLSVTNRFSFGREGSLDTRLQQEDILTDKAMQKPSVGWGPWGEFRQSDEGKSLVRATDGMWLILLGKYGLPGLAGYLMTMLLPSLVIALRLPASVWFKAPFAPAAALMLTVVLSAIDATLNVIRSPVVLLAAGAVAAVAVARLPKPSTYPMQAVSTPCVPASSL